MSKDDQYSHTLTHKAKSSLGARHGRMIGFSELCMPSMSMNKWGVILLYMNPVNMVLIMTSCSGSGLP